MHGETALESRKQWPRGMDRGLSAQNPFSMYFRAYQMSIGCKRTDMGGICSVGQKSHLHIAVKGNRFLVGQQVRS